MQRFERRGYKRGFGSRVDIPKPVKVGEEYDVDISELGARGDGIARVKNFVVFVNGAKKGEKTHIKIKEVRNRFAIGEKVSAAEKAEAEEAPEETSEEETSETPEEKPEEPAPEEPATEPESEETEPESSEEKPEEG
ncbi:MAG: TRAM domain-containing protein [Candidatus Heimdallarchaeota archaeon]